MKFPPSIVSYGYVCIFFLHFFITVSFIDNHVVIRKLFIFIVIALLVAHTVAHYYCAWLRAEYIETTSTFDNWFTFWAHFDSFGVWFRPFLIQSYWTQFDNHEWTCCSNISCFVNLDRKMYIQIQSNWLNQWQRLE